MVGDINRGIQVLNISNVNAQGKTVLNDAKLLELIQKYPFLYNPRVKAYNDSYYTMWAWKNISEAFNLFYANDPKAAFSTEELIKRWESLKPMVQSLSKAYDMEAIPATLRQSVVKISTELDNKSCNLVGKPNSLPQNLLLQNMGTIAKLPLENKLSLEREILDLILSTELENKQSTKLDDAAWRDIYKDTDDFLNEIGFKQVLVTAVNRQEKIFYSNHTDPYSTGKCTTSKNTRGWVPLEDAHKYITPCYVSIERMNIEDYLPLAKIMKIKDKYRDNREY